MKRLVVIDGKSVFYRGYYAMPNLSTRNGLPTGGVYGFAVLALEIIKKLNPDYVAVAWDKEKTNIRKRRQLFPNYKSGRKPAPADFYEQIPVLCQLLEAFGWPLYELDDYEADDIMGAFAHQATEQGIETCLVTSDLDALQCINDLTHVYAIKKGFSNIELFSTEVFEKKYGIKVKQFLDLKSLKGDTSDSILGVPGVGEKTGVELLQKYQTLDAIYDNLWEIKDSLRRKLEDGKASAYLSKTIARIWTDAPVNLEFEKMDIRNFDAAKIKKILLELEFRSLISRLPDTMRINDEPHIEVEESIKSFKKADINDHSLAELKNANQVILYEHEQKIYASFKKGFFYELTWEQLLKIDFPKIIAHGAKDILIHLLENGKKSLPKIFDTRQVAFMIDPLRRSLEIEDIMVIDRTLVGQVISAIWILFEEQMQRLASSPKIRKLALEVDLPLTEVLARMEYRGIMLDSAFLGEMNKDLIQEISDIEQAIYDLSGREFNVASPSQLAEVLFVDLGLSTEGVKKGKKSYSTGQKELNKLRDQHPIIRLIERFRELSKLQNTYVEALPKLVDESSRLHTTFNQDVTVTGRLSSTNPNLQNIPVRSELGRRIREAFVPRQGNVFVNADYSQFELRLVAVLADDKEMIEDFNLGVDIHDKTASEVYKIPIEQVSKEQRRGAKIINFGVLYGMSPHGLAMATGMRLNESKKFINEYFKIREPIRKYIDSTLEKAKRDGYVETYFGRRRPTPDVHSSNFIVRSSAERAAVNMPIQGTEADLMKMAMLKVEQEIDGFGFQVLQVHDSILVECPEENSQKVKSILKETMENICPDLEVKLKVDVKIGNNWGEA